MEVLHSRSRPSPGESAEFTRLRKRSAERETRWLAGSEAKRHRPLLDRTESPKVLPLLGAGFAGRWVSQAGFLSVFRRCPTCEQAEGVRGLRARLGRVRDDREAWVRRKLNSVVAQLQLAHDRVTELLDALVVEPNVVFERSPTRSDRSRSCGVTALASAGSGRTERWMRWAPATAPARSAGRTAAARAHAPSAHSARLCTAPGAAEFRLAGLDEGVRASPA
jgi:hypothetical protein